MAKKALIPEIFKKKQSELFEIDGTYFRVIYQPKAGLNRLEDWVEKLSKRESKATTMEHALETHHAGKLPTKFVDEKDAVSKYIDFIKVCTLYLNREMMEKALRSAPKKKDGTLTGRRVQHLAFTGLAVNFGFYELCAVNDTDNVMLLEIRSSDCSQKIVPAYEGCVSCAEILQENAHLLPTEIKEATSQVISDVKTVSEVPAEIKKQFVLKNDAAGFTIEKYKGNEYHAVIPDQIGGKAVIRIGAQAFFGRSMRGVTIPGTVVKIDNGAFKSCASLMEVEIPESVTSVGQAVFSSCLKLASVRLPDGLNSVGQFAFSWCSALTEITLPTKLKKISQSMFSNCKRLSEITIPEGVTDIQSTAFENCISLTKVVIPDSVRNISNAAFIGCNNLVIYAPKGSYAENYAKENNIAFQEI